MAYPLGLAAPVHPRGVRRASGHAVPRRRTVAYPTKDMVADYLRDYAAHFALPVRLRCAVTRVEQVAGGFVVHTSQGPFPTRQVVVATGPFQAPVVPRLAAGLSGDVVQLHSAEYRRPSDIPAGPVVVVGAGNSGRQIAEELAATHEVTLAVGTAPPQLPQRLLRPRPVLVADPPGPDGQDHRVACWCAACVSVATSSSAPP